MIKLMLLMALMPSQSSVWCEQGRLASIGRFEDNQRVTIQFPACPTFDVRTPTCRVIDFDSDRKLELDIRRNGVYVIATEPNSDEIAIVCTRGKKER